MTTKGLNWMVLGATFFIGGCDTKSDENADEFEVGSSEGADGDSESDADADADADADSDSAGGDGVFNVDQLYLFWDGVYRDGEPATAATFTDSEGEVQPLTTSFQFVWIDSTDYSQDNDDYLCSLVYDSASATVGDFSGMDGASDAYMTYQLDLGALSPEASGNCEGAAANFGVASMEDVAQAQPWGWGYGPMTSDFEDELSDAMDNYSSLGDTPGVSYLRWKAGEDDMFTAWGYFQVIPFESDESDMVITVEDASQLVAGVRDSAEPADGYYMQETVYVLTYGG